MNTKKYGKLKILYEDSSLIVVVKPSGMLSVPFEGSRGKTVLDILSEYLRSKGTDNIPEGFTTTIREESS